MKEKITFEAYLENVMSPQLKKIEADGKKAFASIDYEIAKVDNRMGSLDNTVMKVARNIGGLVAGFAAGAGIARWGSIITETTAKYQTFEAVLTNTLGNSGAAREAFSQIEKFASRTPFQIDELTDSYVRLTNQGFQPTMQQMTKLGDLASSKGKSFTQLTEALIDAEVGEFERLKEFGIRAQKEGDKVTFTFKGQKQQVDFTAESIRAYVLGLGSAAGVSGAMAKISETTGGKISNLKDSFDKLNANIGERYKKEIDAAIESTGRFVSILNDWVEIPVSEKMEDERREANLLASRIMDLNTPEEERLRLLQKLKEINPDIVNGIDEQNISLDKLRTNLVSYNSELMKSITVQQAKEQYEKASRKERNQADDFAKAQVYALTSAFGVSAALEGSDSELAKFTTAFINNDAEMIAKYSGAISGTPALQKQIDKLNKLSGIEREAEQISVIDALFRQIDLNRKAIITNPVDEVSFLKALSEFSNRDQIQLNNKTLSVLKRANITELARTNYEKIAQIMGVDINQSSLEGSSSGTIGGSGSGTDPVSSALGSVSGDNRQMKNITINIDKLGGVENIRISKENEEEDINAFLDKLRIGLMQVVNDVNILAN